jgi:hypothetical protein
MLGRAGIASRAQSFWQASPTERRSNEALLDRIVSPQRAPRRGGGSSDMPADPGRSLGSRTVPQRRRYRWFITSGRAAALPNVSREDRESLEFRCGQAPVIFVIGNQSALHQRLAAYLLKYLSRRCPQPLEGSDDGPKRLPQPLEAAHRYGPAPPPDCCPPPPPRRRPLPRGRFDPAFSVELFAGLPPGRRSPVDGGRAADLPCPAALAAFRSAFSFARRRSSALRARISAMRSAIGTSNRCFGLPA